jgi:hypothetical protein
MKLAYLMIAFRSITSTARISCPVPELLCSMTHHNRYKICHLRPWLELSCYWSHLLLSETYSSFYTFNRTGELQLNSWRQYSD